MNNADDPLVRQLLASPRPLPREDLAAQIVRQATLQTQQTGWQQRWQRTLNEPGYAWHFKLASLTLCGVLGVFAGHWQATALDDNELLISAQMLDSALYTEEP